MQKRKSTRLSGYDYSGRGAYFVTMCSLDRACIFSQVVGGGVLDAPEVHLTQYGQLIEKQISEMNRVYRTVHAEKYVIMPNHIHVLLTMCGEEGSSRTPTPTNSLLARYVSTLKRLTNKAAGIQLWQRGYHDHIIRNEDDYRVRWKYIDENPTKWAAGKDEYYV